MGFFSVVIGVITAGMQTAHAMKRIETDAARKLDAGESTVTVLVDSNEFPPSVDLDVRLLKDVAGHLEARLGLSMTDVSELPGGHAVLMTLKSSGKRPEPRPAAQSAANQAWPPLVGRVVPTALPAAEWWAQSVAVANDPATLDHPMGVTTWDSAAWPAHVARAHLTKGNSCVALLLLALAVERMVPTYSADQPPGDDHPVDDDVAIVNDFVRTLREAVDDHPGIPVRGIAEAARDQLASVTDPRVAEVFGIGAGMTAVIARLGR